MYIYIDYHVKCLVNCALVGTSIKLKEKKKAKIKQDDQNVLNTSGNSNISYKVIIILKHIKCFIIYYLINVI